MLHPVNDAEDFTSAMRAAGDSSDNLDSDHSDASRSSSSSSEGLDQDLEEIRNAVALNPRAANATEADL
jgi:hypothetical protein